MVCLGFELRVARWWTLSYGGTLCSTFLGNDTLLFVFDAKPISPVE